MPVRPSGFRAREAAGRDPRGGSLDPTFVLEQEPSGENGHDAGVDSDADGSAAAAGSAAAVDEPPAAVVGIPGDRVTDATRGPSNWVLGSNAVMRRIAKSIERAAEVECTVLISGETGTGKELWARLLHRSGPRRGKTFIPVNCAALTPSLAESQLFGHEKGAFTGAAGRSLGIFRAAHGGIVFLDEIGEMPMELQPKLLRVLQQREVLPVGATEPVPVDVQIVAATNRDLEAEVDKGVFREDLYYRLNMIELRVPPLRERPEDIPSFVEFFSRRCAERYRLPVWQPSAEALAEFCRFPWPGNVRQLEHVIEQSYVLQIEPTLPVRAAARDAGAGRLPCLDLAELRSRAIKEALEITRGHKAKAAKLLGVHANTMTRLLKELEDGQAGGPHGTDGPSGDDGAADDTPGRGRKPK
jgi:DNA-binding NtrC family response regulator